MTCRLSALFSPVISALSRPIFAENEKYRLIHLNDMVAKRGNAVLFTMQSGTKDFVGGREVLIEWLRALEGDEG